MGELLNPDAQPIRTSESLGIKYLAILGTGKKREAREQALRKNCEGFNPHRPSTLLFFRLRYNRDGQLCDRLAQPSRSSTAVLLGGRWASHDTTGCTHTAERQQYSRGVSA